MAKSLARNIGWLGTANIAVKPIWFLFITAGCMRVLGEENYGLLTAALALASVSSSFVDMGASRYTSRSLAQGTADGPQLLSSLSAARLSLSAASFLICVILGMQIGFSGPRILTLIGAAIYILLLNLLTYLRVPFQAFEDLRAEAISLIIEKLAVVGFGVLALFATRRPDHTVLAMSAGVGVALLYTYRTVSTRFVALSPASINYPLIRKTFRGMLALGIAGIIGVIYPRIDLLMIKSMMGDAATGNYSAAYRFLEAVLFVPAIVSISALYPRYARQNQDKRFSESTQLVVRSVGLMALVGIAIGAILYVLSDPILNAFSPDESFVLAPTVLRWLVWTIPLTFVSSVFFSAMLAQHDERFLAVILLILTLANVGLNLVLIPSHGIVGAAIATIVTEVAMVTCYGGRFWLLNSRRESTAGDQSSST